MSMAIDAFNRTFAAMTRINSGNQLMNNNQAMTQLIAPASKLGFGRDSFVSLRQQENAIMQSNLNNQLMYKIANQMEQTQGLRDKEKENKALKKLDYFA